MISKKICLFGLAAVALFSGCSSDDDVYSDEAVIFETGNSDVEIRLSSGTSGTRAPIESDSEGNFTIDGTGSKWLGIFCLANGYQNETAKALEVSWDPENKDTRDYSLWKTNIRAKAVKPTAENGYTATQIEFADGGYHYYPLGNWHRYCFYGYYPQRGKDEIVYSDNKITVDMPIDGMTDIIWGMPENIPSADEYSSKFSARYIRQGNPLPKIKFEHKLIHLRFLVRAGESEGSFDEAKKLKVSSIVLENIPNKGTLTIADMAGTLNGDFQVDETSRSDIYLRRPNPEDPNVMISTLDFLIKDVVEQNNNEFTQIHDGLLIPVPAADEQLSVKIGLKDVKTGVSYNQVTKGFLTLKNDTFKPGYYYDVPLTVYGPKEIKIEATLENWKEGGPVVDANGEEGAEDDGFAL